MFEPKTLKPETEEEIRLAQSYSGMRILVERHHMHNPLVMQAMRLKFHHKINDLDMMTVIAFNAIQEAEALRKLATDQAMRAVSEPLYVDAKQFLKSTGRGG